MASDLSVGMSRRTLATFIAVALAAVLLGATAMIPLPYVRYQPGSTVDLLSEVRGDERVEVHGHATYHDGGELRMTTVVATPPGMKISLLEAMTGWLSGDEAVKQYDEVYRPQETLKSQEAEAALQMSSSQEVSVVAALTELGIEVPMIPVVGAVSEGMPADGKLEVRARCLRIDGREITAWDDVVKAVSTATPGKEIEFVVERGGQEHTLDIAPKKVDDRVVVGIERGYEFELPFEVKINLAEEIGGPSAGLMFALSVFDTLTPGSLTGGARVAGTGTIEPTGEVGPIGGIQQKVAGARLAGAELFLVPDVNCAEALSGAAGDMRLTAVSTLAEAEQAITTYAADPDADLPTCEETLADARSAG